MVKHFCSQWSSTAMLRSRSEALRSIVTTPQVLQDWPVGFVTNQFIMRTCRMNLSLVRGVFCYHIQLKCGP